MKWLVLTMLAAFATVVSAGEIARMYERLAGSDPESYPLGFHNNKVELKDHGVSEIGLERTRCFGRCPAYCVVIKKDGSFAYNGVSDVERLGRHTGHIGQHSFDKLARFIVESGYMEFQNAYSIPVTDHPTVYTTVVRNGVRKTIRNYAGAGPAGLWAVEQLIDKQILEAEWDRSGTGED